MFIIRITIALVLIAGFVLIAAFVITKNKKYLIATKQLLTYAAWFAVILVLFSLIARVIRF